MRLLATITQGRLDLIEAATNATVGALVSVLAVWSLWPLFGWQASCAQSVAVTALFWALPPEFQQTKLHWLAPCRKRLERVGDYE